MRAADPAAVFAQVADTPYAQLLDWRTGSGWAYVLLEPDRVATCDLASLDPHKSPTPFQQLDTELAEWAAANGYIPSDTPVPFTGGAGGFFAYELAHGLERLPPLRPGRTVTPALATGFYDAVAAFPADGHAAYIVSPWESTGTREKRARLRSLIEKAETPAPPPATRCAEPAANFARAAYEAAVAEAIELIHAGDIFQVNLSQRFETALADGVTPFDIYRRLAGDAPAPFAAHLNIGEATIVSSSPERFLRADSEGRVVTEPIKGTRPRGATPALDRALAEELEASAKDRAENVMIVDLLRNDLSKVCADHSVKVEALCSLRSFANVHHLVSKVTGTLRPEVSALDLLAACFPGGSITGAPKVRAMEIIADLEPHARGPYCGAIGWIGLDGAMDTSIAIRTLTISNRTVTYHAGGGIVADSDPAAEYDETIAKASAMRRALAGDAP